MSGIYKTYVVRFCTLFLGFKNNSFFQKFLNHNIAFHLYTFQVSCVISQVSCLMGILSWNIMCTSVISWHKFMSYKKYPLKKETFQDVVGDSQVSFLVTKKNMDFQQLDSLRFSLQNWRLLLLSRNSNFLLPDFVSLQLVFESSRFMTAYVQCRSLLPLPLVVMTPIKISDYI